MPGSHERPMETTLPLLPPSAAVLVADDEARFREVNDAATRLLKYSASELTAMHVWDITAGPQLGDAKLMWKDFLSHGRQAGVYQVRRSDGRRVTVQYEATANVEPGRHLSILQPVSRAQPETRPLDECPFERPFPRDFNGCPAYQPVLAQMADSREQPIAQVWTCDHLTGQRIASKPTYYARCALGDAVDRSAWLQVAAERSLLKVRELRADFYRAAEKPIRRLITLQALSRSSMIEPAADRRLRAAGEGVLAALSEFLQRRRAALPLADLEATTLQRAVAAALDEWRLEDGGQGLRPSEDLISTYPLAVQAFLRPDLVAGAHLSDGNRPFYDALSRPRVTRARPRETPRDRPAGR